MKWKIKIYYRTGNSFSSEDCEDFIEHEWDSYEKAEENAKRIEDHYYFYLKELGTYTTTYKELEARYGDEKWFRKTPYDENRKHNQIEQVFSSVVLETEDGKSFPYSTYQWIGYFESLHGVEVAAETYKADIDLYRY